MAGRTTTGCAMRTGRSRYSKTKEVGIPIRPGDRLLVEAGGGGGWGDPAQRTPEARARDAAEGYV